MKKTIKTLAASLVMLLMLLLLSGCSGELSDDYVTISKYKGLEVEKPEEKKITDEDVDNVIELMLTTYARTELDADAPKPELTDELARQFSDTSETVEEYRQEIKEKIEKKSSRTARQNLENQVWAQVMDNATVKNYPAERQKEIEEQLRSQYTLSAAQSDMPYEEYVSDVLGITEEELSAQLQETAQAVLKQELVSELLAKKYELTPTEEEYELAVQDYVETFGFSNRKALEAIAPEKELRIMITQDRVKAWLVEQSKIKTVQNDNDEDSENN